MPYIEESRRKELDTLDQGRKATTSGELNYMITRLCLGYLKTHKLTYITCNDIMGALDCAKKEFYRRIITPYEDLKIEANGDVY